MNDAASKAKETNFIFDHVVTVAPSFICLGFTEITLTIFHQMIEYIFIL